MTTPNIIIEIDVPAEMRDGTILRSDLYRPEGGAAHPVLLLRMPYNKSDPRYHVFYDPVRMARSGYAVVWQDCRGTGTSDGHFQPFNEAEDGYDTVEWLGSQPWSIRKIGTMGDSYAGSDQCALATLNPSHLSTMIVAVGASNYYHSSMRHNGALEQRFQIYAFRMAITSKEAADDPALKKALIEIYNSGMAEIIKQFPLKEGTTILSRLPSYER